MNRLAACAAVLLVSGCQTWGPSWSELIGVRYNDVTSMTDGPVVVNLVDGTSPGTAPRQAIKLTPGQHTLVLQAVPPGAMVGQINLEKTVVEFKPCTRYYINARFESSTSTSWRPYIDYEEMIPGCQVPKAG